MNKGVPRVRPWPQFDAHLVRALLAFALVSGGCAPREPQSTAPTLYSGEVLSLKPAGDRVYARRLVLRYENRSDRPTRVECGFDPVLTDGSLAARRFVTSPKIQAGGSLRFQSITELAVEPDAIAELRPVGCKRAAP